jgi:hypothetical protein
MSDLLERPLAHFEIGKYYKHTSGATLYPCAYAGTNIYGVTMIAETGEGGFKPIGSGPDACANWREVTAEEF